MCSGSGDMAVNGGDGICPLDIFSDVHDGPGAPVGDGNSIVAVPEERVARASLRTRPPAHVIADP